MQAFLPTPLAIASAMYHTGLNPLKKIGRTGNEVVSVVTRAKQRRLHKAFLRYHDPDNWPLLREALKQMGRADLIGNGKRHLVPAWQPGGKSRGTTEQPARMSRVSSGKKPARTGKRTARKPALRR